MGNMIGFLVAICQNLIKEKRLFDSSIFMFICGGLMPHLLIAIRARLTAPNSVLCVLYFTLCFNGSKCVER